MGTRAATRVRFAPLPEGATSEPDRADQEVLATWRSENTFDEVQRARAGAPPFVFWEGPPTANGRPGIHHVLSRTLKDAVCRFQTMAGKRVERKAGWDTHGLPVELEVEKALGISGKPAIEAATASRTRFNAECRKSVWKYREEWERLSERIGYWLDYADPYVTYEPSYVDSVWYLLASFHRAGLVYRGKRVLPYCGRCGTGLSSHELGQPGVYRDVQDPSVIVRFRLAARRAEPSPRASWPGPRRPGRCRPTSRSPCTPSREYAALPRAAARRARARPAGRAGTRSSGSPPSAPQAVLGKE